MICDQLSPLRDRLAPGCRGGVGIGLSEQGFLKLLNRDEPCESGAQPDQGRDWITIEKVAGKGEPPACRNSTSVRTQDWVWIFWIGDLSCRAR